MKRRLAAALLLAALAAAPASAAPALFPRRDVTIDYAANADGQHGTLHAEIEAGGVRLRLTSDLLIGAIILDRPADAGLLLQPALHAALRLSLHAIGADVYFPDSGEVALSAAGSDHVGGRACALWDARTARGHARLCLTEDGVLLRAEGEDRHGRHGSLVARAVSYGTLAAERFTLPPGWRMVPLGALPGRT